MHQTTEEQKRFRDGKYRLAELEKLSSKEEVAALPHIHRPHIDKIKITCPHCGEKVERIKEVNELSSDEVRAGDKLLIVKGA